VKRLAGLAALVLCGAASAATPPRFSATVDNAWFPLKPGTVYHYRGVKDGEPSREVLTVTHRTRTIAGARCVEIADLLYLSGRLEERTTEWYSQDAAGNVWYFGENTAELDRHGRVKTTSGSWRAGVGGAHAGLFMFAHPRVGRSAQQEYLNGEAEDHFQVVSLHAQYRGKRALLTKEWTPLEPGVLDHKYYVRGIGTVLEQTVKGPVERNVLVSVSHS
jgi:hypothetical protein